VQGNIIIGYSNLAEVGIYHHSAVIAMAVGEAEEERDRSLCNIVKNKVMSKGLPMKSSTPAAKAACMVS